MQVYASEKRSQPSQNECANHVGNAHNLRCHINKEIGQPAPHACRCSIAPRFMSRHRAMSSIPISMVHSLPGLTVIAKCLRGKLLQLMYPYDLLAMTRDFCGP